MEFIVFDLEFNQYTSPGGLPGVRQKGSPFEIIQIGAVKLDGSLEASGEFARFVRPSVYTGMDPFISELTGISFEDIAEEDPFPIVLAEFLEFAGGKDAVLCSWGMSDIKELFRSALRSGIDQRLLPSAFIDIQLHAARYLGLSKRKLPSLQSAAEVLAIPAALKFHNALNDAVYTSEVFRRIYDESIHPENYDPSYKRVRLRQTKSDIDYDGLLRQFEKMYSRPMTDEEKKIIFLAYKMGRTRQFAVKKTQEVV
jgi:DNA polymerase III epsilon subunit-like protein